MEEGSGGDGVEEGSGGDRMGFYHSQFQPQFLTITNSWLLILVCVIKKIPAFKITTSSNDLNAASSRSHYHRQSQLNTHMHTHTHIHTHKTQLIDILTCPKTQQTRVFRQLFQNSNNNKNNKKTPPSTIHRGRESK